MNPQLWGPYLVCSQRYNKCLLNQRVTVIPISWLLPRNLLPWQTHRPCTRYPEQGDEGCKDIPRVFFMTTASWQVGDISTGVRHERMICWLWSGWASTANSLILSLQTCQSKLFLFPCESSRSVRGTGNGFGQPDPKCVQWCQGHHSIKKKYINLPRISSSETSSRPAQNTEWMGFLCPLTRAFWRLLVVRPAARPSHWSPQREIFHSSLCLSPLTPTTRRKLPLIDQTLQWPEWPRPSIQGQGSNPILCYLLLSLGRGPHRSPYRPPNSRLGHSTSPHSSPALSAPPEDGLQLPPPSGVLGYKLLGRLRLRPALLPLASPGMFHFLSLSDKLLNTLRGPVQKHLANLHPGENMNTRNHSGLHIKALSVAGPPPHDERPIYELSPGYNFSVSCNCLTLVTEVFTCICVVSLTRW